MIRKGDVLAGRYRVEKPPMGYGVFMSGRAIDLLLDQPVAILFPGMRRGEQTTEHAIAWLSRETQVPARIKSDNVVRIFHVGTLDTGETYTVTEYLVGTELRGWLARRGVLPIEQAVHFLLQACDAVAEAHSLGLVHRDIKPANLFASEPPGLEPSIKVLGWGLSKTLDIVSTKLEAVDGTPPSGTSKAYDLVGTPLYMSPEQVKAGQEVDARTDIWSLGVTLCELVTGNVPFKGSSFEEIFSYLTSDAPPPLRDSFPHLPQGLQAAILKCLERDRQKRYQSVADLALALLGFGSERAKPLVDRICFLPKHMS